MPEHDLAESDLAARVQHYFDICKLMHERRNPDGTFTIPGREFLALLELRNLAPEIVAALEKAR